MKFSHTLSLNANPDWERHYIDYANLKKLINETDAQAHNNSIRPTAAAVTIADGEDGSSTSLEQHELAKKFLEKLLKQVVHVREFYDEKLAELEQEMARLQPILEKSASQQNLAGMGGDAGDNSGEAAPLLKAALKPADLEDRRAEICDMFTRFHNLEMFAELNCKYRSCDRPKVSRCPLFFG